MLLAEEEVSGTALLLPETSEIAWTLIFLVIFALVFMKFVLPRLNAVLEERAEKIEGGLRHAEAAQAQADQMRAEQEHELAAARQEAASIREKARQDGAQLIEEAKERAAAEAERVLATGRQHLEAERMTASHELRGEVGSLASELASRIVGESLTDDERSSRVIDRFLADLESTSVASR